MCQLKVIKTFKNSNVYVQSPWEYLTWFYFVTHVSVASYVPGMVLSALNISSVLLLTANLQCKYSYCLDCTEEDIKVDFGYIYK